MLKGERFEDTFGNTFKYLGVTNCEAEAILTVKDELRFLTQNDFFERCPVIDGFVKFKRTHSPNDLKCTNRSCQNWRPK